MPSLKTVEAFVAQVVSGDHVGAIRDWYLEDAWMQENQAEPRRGRDVLMQQEAAMLARAESVENEILAPPLIAGDDDALRWRFTFQFKAGGSLRMEEVAWQTWRGDKIAEETFFYDPAQRSQSLA